MKFFLLPASLPAPADCRQKMQAAVEQKSKTALYSGEKRNQETFKLI